MKKYTYKNKKTNQIIQSDVKLTDENLVLVKQIRDTQLKASRIIQK